MKIVEVRQQHHSGYFIVKHKHASHFVLNADFEQANVCWVYIENTNTLKVRSSISWVMLQYFQCEQNLWTDSMWTYIITTLWVGQSEILAKDYTSDIDSGYKDAAHIQNGLLCICLFTDFAHWETN